MAEEYLDQSSFFFNDPAEPEDRKGDLLQVESSHSPRLCFGDKNVDSVVIDALDREEPSKGIRRFAKTIGQRAKRADNRWCL
jgi:hypothetical protein